MTGLGDTIELSLIKQMEMLAMSQPGVISLAQGIPSFDTPEPIKRRSIGAINEGRVAQYSSSSGLSDLREEIEDELEKDGMSYDFAKEIIVTAGSIEAICATLLTILDPGDEVILPSPTYTSYVQAISVARGVPIFIPLHEEGGWTLDLDYLKNKLTSRTRAILLCNPNNPTGSIFSKKQLLAIGEIAESYNLIILTDEVYKDFIYDKEAKNNFFTLASVSALRHRVVRIFSFSKAYAMTGWRIGYLHTDRALAQRILRVHDSLITCAPVVSQHAAMAALRLKPPELQQYIDEYKLRRQILCDGLNALDEYFSYTVPAATYFVFPKIKVKMFPAYSGSLSFAKDLLEKVNLAVVPGIAFGPKGEHHLRLSFGRSRQDINEGLRRLSGFIKMI